MRKRLIHKSDPNRFQSDMIHSCWNALYMKNPLWAKRWAGVTCKKCLIRKGY